MPEAAGQREDDFAGAIGPAGEWGFGPAGWSVAYVSDALAAQVADADPEAVALRLWNEGRKDEAIAFLESRVSRAKRDTQDTKPIAPDEAGRVETGRALVVVPSPASSVAAAQPMEIIAPGAGPGGPAEAAGKLIHIAPEPRVGDAGGLQPVRPGGSARRWLMAAALVVGSLGAGAAFWPGGDAGPRQTAESPEQPAAPTVAPRAEPVALRAALPDKRRADSPDEGRAEARSAVAPPAPSSSSADAAAPVEPVPRPPSAAAPPTLESAAVAPAPALPLTPADVEPAPAEVVSAPAADAPTPLVTARAEPATPAAPPEAAERAVATARLPNPRPRFAGRSPAPAPVREQPDEVAVVEIPPPAPRVYVIEPGDDYLPEGEYDDLPPVLAERRAAAARYAARRRAAERMDEAEENGVPDGPPVFTIQGPVILRAARGLVP